MHHYYGPMMNGGDRGWGILMMLFWAIVLAVVIYVAVRLFKGHDASNQASGPLDIAKERYAKGEITKDQFEQLKKDLSK